MHPCTLLTTSSTSASPGVPRSCRPQAATEPHCAFHCSKHILIVHCHVLIKTVHLCSCCLQVSCKSAPGDDLVNVDSLGDSASTVRNYAFASFWVQLPLTIVSACILIFALLYSKGVSSSMVSDQHGCQHCSSAHMLKLQTGCAMHGQQVVQTCRCASAAAWSSW